ncbi:hypothetical protein KIPB_001629 [Kipferlia bialata]|uniref:Uncharacterized protein n=1 Tax=Kipferlia bialata TaxID=797122 RepID=A0A9K3CP50_9EUKA|nr:hypothetical protein KIPB_001629 [Kipferlia bialata]|eukprot:g1629.t1
MMGHPRWYTQPQMLERHFDLIKYALLAYIVSVTVLVLQTLLSLVGYSPNWHPVTNLLLRVGLFWLPAYEAYFAGALLSLVMTESTKRCQSRVEYSPTELPVSRDAGSPQLSESSYDLGNVERHIMSLPIEGYGLMVLSLLIRDITMLVCGQSTPAWVFSIFTTTALAGLSASTVYMMYVMMTMQLGDVAIANTVFDALLHSGCENKHMCRCLVRPAFQVWSILSLMATLSVTLPWCLRGIDPMRDSMAPQTASLPLHILYVFVALFLPCMPDPLVHGLCLWVASPEGAATVAKEVCPSYSGAASRLHAYLRWVLVDADFDKRPPVPVAEIFDLMVGEEGASLESYRIHRRRHLSICMFPSMGAPVVSAGGLTLITIALKLPKRYRDRLFQHLVSRERSLRLRKWLRQTRFVAPYSSALHPPLDALSLNDTGLAVHSGYKLMQKLLDDMLHEVSVSHFHTAVKLCAFHLGTGLVLSHTTYRQPCTPAEVEDTRWLPIAMTSRLEAVTYPPMPVPIPPPMRKTLMFPPVAAPPMGALARCLQAPFLTFNQEKYSLVTLQWFRTHQMPLNVCDS